MLLISFIILLLSYAEFYVMTVNLGRQVEKIYTEIADNAEKTTEDAFYSQAQDALKTIVAVQAKATDKALETIKDVVSQASDYAENLYATPNETRKVYDVIHLSKSSSDVVSGRYMLSTGVKMTPEIQKEIDLISNMQEIYVPIMEYNNAIDDLYIGTASGIFYQYTNSNVFHADYIVTGRTWYVTARDDPDNVQWQETHIDSFGKACLTVSKAIVGKNGEILGVAAADIPFEALIGKVLADGLGSSGESFILGKTYNMIAFTDKNSPDKTMSFNEETKGIENHFPDPKTVIAHLRSGSDKAFYAILNGRKVYMMGETIPTTGWTLCAAIESEEIINPIKTVKNKTSEIITGGVKDITGFIKTLIINIVVSFVVIGIAVAVVTYFLARSITKPIKHLQEHVSSIGDGDFDKKIEPESKDEIGELSLKFNDMQDRLKDYMNNLQTLTVEKERLGAELNVATQIQADMLPRIFPPFPEKSNIKLFASMDPAKEVGGDFYDFFLIDDDHLAFVIADVSGKGVPAALFMVISKTLIKNRAFLGGTPAEILADVNNQLCEGNEAEMFVTCWLGILDLKTGKLIAANAGHEYPAICGSDKHFELLKDKHGFVLAGMENARYKDYEITLEKNGGFFIYTDGVPEATNENGELFGADRMLASLNECSHMEPEDILSNVRAKAFEFTGNAPQFDDLTMVGFIWLGAESEVDNSDSETKIILNADVSEIDRLNSFIEDETENHSFPMKTTLQLKIAAEEIFSNIARYAYPDSHGTAEIAVSFIEPETESEHETIKMTFCDRGVAFDPLAKDDPDITASADERQIGGLGIFMVKKSMDKVEYKRENDKNILTIYKKP